MSRLIDADALERDGWQMSRTVRISKDTMEFQTRKPTDFPAIEDAPAIEPKRMRGKWVKEDIVLTSNPPQYQWHCSECGQEIHGFYDAVLSNFCPSCGADMRGTE